MMKKSKVWTLSHSQDVEARVIADRHYNRQKPGTPRFVPPGRCLVLKRPNVFWVTSWPFAKYTKHAWAGAFVCSAFRNEGTETSSMLIREALACTRWKYPEIPEKGMITFVDPKKVKPTKRRGKNTWGYCYLKAGFKEVGKTKKNNLLAFQILEEDFPEPLEPLPCPTLKNQKMINKVNRENGNA